MRRSLPLIAVLFALAIRAQAPSSFREGVLAFEKGEWAKAESAMRTTIAVNPNEVEGTVSIAGSWFETYVPHYFLARALGKQGKCTEALKEFAESERQGVTPTISDFARHLKTRDGCGGQAKAAKPPREVTEVTVPFGDVPAKPEAVKPPVAKPSVVQPPVTKPAVVPPRPAPVSPPPAVDPRILAEKARLSAAATDYLRGRYTEAVRQLDPTQFNDRAAAAEAALLRAASQYALYRIGGEKDQALKRNINLDLQTYRALRGGAHPDPRIYPPSFIALTR